RNSTAITVKMPGCPTSAIFAEMCAMLSVPTTEYRSATATTNNADEMTFTSKYLIDSRSCLFFSARTNNTYEAISNTSKKTNKLKISPVVNAPLIPVNMNKTAG